VATFGGFVELTEGPWLLTRMFPGANGEPQVGAPAVLHVLATDGEPIYVFEV
jgi:hypothetical protein